MKNLFLFLCLIGFSPVLLAKTVPDDVAKRAEENVIINAFKAYLYSATGTTEAEFNEALDKVGNHYGPILAKRGVRLNIIRNWTDSTVNAYADRNGSTWNIHAFGGLARASGMTYLGYATVTCHELGHHLGGAPRYGNNTDWAANEGESDYWASKECMKAIGFTDEQIQQGALSTASVLASLGGERAPSTSTPSAVVVRNTQDAHPPAQCRLDTYLDGGICKLRGDMSNTNPKINSCYYYPNGVKAPGSRPRCWFAPVDQGTPNPGDPPPTPPTPVPPNPTPNPPRQCPPAPTCPAPKPCPACTECKLCIWR